MKYRNIVGPQIRHLRGLKRWSQKHLAGRLSRAGSRVTRSIVASWEVRRSPVNDKQLFTLGRVFGVRISKLFPQRIGRATAGSHGAEPC